MASIGFSVFCHFAVSSHNQPPRPEDPGNTGPDRRRMVPGRLLGSHSHETADGRKVHVWVRGSKYLARGYYNRKAFGQDLGTDPREAAAALRRLLVQLEDGTFIPPSEARKRQLKARQAPRHTVRQLCDAFLCEKRSVRGRQTADDYRTRLTPLIEFSEQPRCLQQWPLAADMDQSFVVQFRKSLHERMVTRNGRAAAQEKPLSVHQIFNILDCARTMVNWARQPEVQHLP